MQYVQAIFENENVRTYVSENEQLIDLAAATVASYRPALIEHVFENLQDFVEEDDLAATYENIKTFIIAENLYLYEAVSDVLADTELTVEETVVFLEASNGAYYLKKAMDSGVGKNIRKGVDYVASKGKKISEFAGEKLDNLTARSLRSNKLFDGSGGKRGSARRTNAEIFAKRRSLIKGGIAAAGLTAAGAAALGGAGYVQNKKEQADLLKGAAVAGGVAGAGGLAYGAKKYANRK